MVPVGLLLPLWPSVSKRPLLYLFGASDDTIGYADDYVTIYLLGNIFVMVGLGMNSFINSQGFGTIGMMTVLFWEQPPIFYWILYLYLDFIWGFRERLWLPFFTVSSAV